MAAKVQLTDEDIAAGYEKLQDATISCRRGAPSCSCLSPRWRTLRRQSRVLPAATDFLAVAKERGFAAGDITFADKAKTDFLDPAIADAAFALTEGSVSEPVKGNLNTVLLKATKVSPEKQSTLDEVRGCAHRAVETREGRRGNPVDL